MLHGLAGRLARRCALPLAAVAAVLLAAAPMPAAATADGPDFWMVQGVPKGDTLNVRSGPSTTKPIVRQLPNGFVLRNLGCNPQRWCHVKAPDGSFTGWASLQFLVESGGPGNSGGRPPYNGGGSGPHGGSVSVPQMADYCLGEAAGYFRVKPGALRTNPAFASGKGYSVIGWFAKQSGRGFRCEFHRNGTFAGVFE